MKLFVLGLFSVMTLGAAIATYKDAGVGAPSIGKQRSLRSGSPGYVRGGYRYGK